MTMPSAVRKASEESERLAVEHGLKPGQGDEEQGKQQQQAAPATPAPAEPAKPTEEVDWEKRFKNYKKETDQTISDLRETVGVSQNQLAESQRQIQEMIKAQQEKPVETEKPDKEKFLESLPAEMREKYEPEFLESMSQLNSIQMTSIIGDLQRQIDELKGDVSQVSTNHQLTAREQYYKDLDDKEPDWEKIGAEEAFIEYLNTPVSEFDTRTYHQVLSDADASNDAATVLKIIAAYKKDAGIADPEVTTTQGNNTLEELASPDAGNGSASVIEDIGPQTEAFTESQVTKFYADCTKGNVYTNEEAIAIEKKIQAAQQAGKISPG